MRKNRRDMDMSNTDETEIENVLSQRYCVKHGNSVGMKEYGSDTLNNVIGYRYKGESEIYVYRFYRNTRHGSNVVSVLNGDASVVSSYSITPSNTVFLNINTSGPDGGWDDIEVVMCKMKSSQCKFYADYDGHTSYRQVKNLATQQVVKNVFPDWSDRLDVVSVIGPLSDYIGELYVTTSPRTTKKMKKAYNYKDRNIEEMIV